MKKVYLKQPVIATVFAINYHIYYLKRYCNILSLKFEFSSTFFSAYALLWKADEVTILLWFQEHTVLLIITKAMVHMEINY
jgi:hypothetical protein